MDFANLAIQLICGIVGGNAAAAMFPDKRLGRTGNTAACLAGGMFGAQTLTLALGMGPGFTGMIQNAAGSGSGGAMLMIATGFVSSAFKR